MAVVTTVEVPTVAPDGPGGAQCLTYVAQPAFALQTKLGYGNEPLADTLLGDYPACPPTPVAPAAPPAGPDPQTLAEAFWRTIRLPAPAPTVPPGYAVTGKTAYLVTGGQLHPAPFTEATPLGRLSVTASGTYDVDWGDGTDSGPFAVEGAPWPSGVITHVYDVVGDPTVVVTERWTATWTLGGAEGILGGLQTTAPVPGFSVRQIQAVITSQ